MRDEQDSRQVWSAAGFLATGGYGRGTPADPIGTRSGRPLYRVICSPALAEITGDGRAWTVSMISALSMPWR
jgi:hypothetical protein